MDAEVVRVREERGGRRGEEDSSPPELSPSESTEMAPRDLCRRSCRCVVVDAMVAKAGVGLAAGGRGREPRSSV